MKQKVSKKTKTVWMMNGYHIKVKKCCASCQFKEIDKEGNRICTKMQLIIGQRDKCKQWLMSDGLKNAGKGGGVVRLKGTTEIVIK